MIAELNLTPRQRQAALLYYGHRMRVVDIAVAMGFRKRTSPEDRGHSSVSRLLRCARRKYPMLTRRYHRRDFDPFADAP